jgi:ABC-type sugar transport system substrate-binding protein
MLRSLLPTRVGAAAILAGLALLSAPFDAAAQQASKVVRIGVLGYLPGSQFAVPLLQRLRELGYVEGSSVQYEYPAKGSFDEQATELAQKPVDLLFAT